MNRTGRRTRADLSIELQIRRKLADYLARQLSLRSLESWLLGSTWDLEETQEPVAARLAQAIDLRLIERSNGHWTEDELRSQLGALLDSYLPESR